MIQFAIYDHAHPFEANRQEAVVDFLYENLQAYGDPKPHISKAMDYATQAIPSFGGFVVTLTEDEKLKGAVVINRTGMSGYIPENILVYIATHQDHRGEGLGTRLMKKAIEHAQGDIALHVEASNPAIKLYEKLGFTNPYLEMRLKRSSH